MAEMFDQLVHPPATIRGRRRYTLPASIVVHSALIGAVVVVPLLATGGIPTPRSMLVYAVPPALPPPPAVAPAPARASTPQAVSPQPAVPTEAPPSIAREDPVAPPALAVTGVPGALAGLPPATSVALGAPPPVPAPRVEPYRLGGQIREPVKIHNVNPVYPPVAVAAKVSGVVEIEATIGTDGRVTNARVTHSIPLLDEAALVAVRQWQFTPTMLNGIPVPVIMTVRVTFAIQ